VIGQSELPETIIVPLSSLGNVSEDRKQILQNSLTDELKKHFRIVPKEKFEEVLEKVFEELEYEEYEECREDQCIMRVQGMLQVGNVFNLQVLGDDKDTQLYLTWRTLDEKKNEEDYCEECGTHDLRKMIGGLVEKLYGKGVLYLSKRNGEWEWYKSGNEEKDGKYVGEIENGVPNGQGKSTNPNGRKYEGEWKDGKQNGKGIFTTLEGVKYIGGWKDRKMNGQGTFTYSNGSKYVGEWKDGERWNSLGYDEEGNIRYRYVNGIRYNYGNLKRVKE
tara:strand:- start:15 stop:842 length:828 start_codon:yes stop_codon:yes gene_type:complete